MFQFLLCLTFPPVPFILEKPVRTRKNIMSTRTEKAIAFFTSVPRAGNCAQCVTKAFADDAAVMEMAACGGGNAPGGLCGALYAAMSLAGEKDRESLRSDFRERAGSDLCRELKGSCGTPCRECVEIASELLEKKWNK